MDDKTRKQAAVQAALTRREDERRIARALRLRPAAPFHTYLRAYRYGDVRIPGPEALLDVVARMVGSLALAGRAVRGMLRPMALMLAGTAAVAGVLVEPRIKAILQTVAANRACSAQVGVYDSGGLLVHSIAGSAEPCPIASVPIRDPELRRKLKRAILITEGEVAGLAAPAGQNLKGILRRVGAKLYILEGTRGATGPAQSNFEVLAGQPQGLGPVDKVMHMIAGAWFFTTDVTTEDGRLDLIIDTMPMTQGGGQRGLAGELGLRALWGGDGQPTSLAQICVTARAMAFPPVIATDVRRTRLANLTWARLLGPSAAQCVTEMAAGDAERQAALTELDALCGYSIACRKPFGGLPPGLSDAARADASEERMIAAVVASGGRLGAIGAQPKLPPETATVLTDAMQFALPGAALTTTVSLGAGRDLHAALPGILDGFGARLPTGACFRGDCPADAEPLDYEITLSEVTAAGPIARLTAASVHGGVYGPAVTRHGQRVPGEPLFGEASVQKVVVALVAAKHGVAEVCIADPAVPLSRCAPAARMSIAEAITSSKPDAFMAVARLYPRDIEALQDALGLPGAEHLDAAYGAAYGIGRVMAAAHVHTLFAAIYGNGKAPGLAMFADAPVGPPLDLMAMGYTADVLVQVQEWLAQPVLRPNGTLHDLQEKLPGIDIQGGKSGTHKEGLTRLKIAAALVLKVNGRPYILTFAIWSPRNGPGLGDLRHRDIAPLVAAAVEALRDNR